MNANERDILREAAIHAGFPSSEADRFCSEIENRLVKGAQEYGEDGYLKRSFPECEAEAIEEQADAGGWTSLALRLLDRDVAAGFPTAEADLVRLHALQGVGLAHQAKLSFESAIEHYRQFEHRIEQPPEQPMACHDDRLALS